MRRSGRFNLVGLCVLAACARGGDSSGTGDDDPTDDASTGGARADGATSDGTPSAADASPAGDGAVTDAAIDAVVAIDAGGGGAITGGPCLSGAPGATGYRIRWANAGGTAQVVYEVNGLPDHSRDHAGAFGYQIGFTPAFVDPFLGEGGLRLDSSDFVDLELTTVGLAQIGSARLAIYGRSYNTTTSGSFTWQTFDGLGAAPTNLVSNAAPYHWYAADMTGEISPGDDGVLIRIKAGPSSGSLVVHRIELCLQAT